MNLRFKANFFRNKPTSKLHKLQGTFTAKRCTTLAAQNKAKIEAKHIIASLRAATITVQHTFDDDHHVEPEMYFISTTVFLLKADWQKSNKHASLHHTPVVVVLCNFQSFTSKSNQTNRQLRGANQDQK